MIGNAGDNAKQPQTSSSVSQCVDALMRSMWGGGIARSNRVEWAKSQPEWGRDLSVGDGARRAQAAVRIWEAAVGGELKIHCLPISLSEDGAIEPVEGEFISNETEVAPDVLRLVIRTRERGLPDFIDRAQRSPDTELDSRGRALRGKGLFVALHDFRRWLEQERKKGKWPSQRTRKAPPIGRPSQRQSVSARIAQLVEAGRWNGADGIPALRRILAADADRFGEITSKIPSEDTLARAVCQHWIEMGDDRFKIASRARRKRSLPQNTEETGAVD